MANREALRELQSRLAERLQLARTEARQQSWLAVECAGQGLLVPLPTAGEIFPVGTLLPVPHTQPWFMGVANLRGGLHGVADLAAFLGLRPAVGARRSARTGPPAGLQRHRGFALRGAGGPPGRPAQCRATDGRSRRQTSHARPLPARSYQDAEGRRWQEIDLAALARHEQFLAIAA
jgi:twitching motility protein PilI